MRLFVGIAVAVAAAEELAIAQARLRGCADGLRWTSAESWHITLQFLGETSPERCACITAQLRAVRARPVEITLEEFGCFERAGVVFVGVRPTTGLAALHGQVTAATGHCGIVAETRPFAPHITLARKRGRAQPLNLRTLKNRMIALPPFSRFVAQEILLYESFLGADDPRYEVRERFALDAEATEA